MQNVRIQKYGNAPVGLGILSQNGNRNEQCKHFVKLAVQGRKGSRNSTGVGLARTSGFAVERDEFQEPNAHYQGATIFVNSMAEEGGFSTQAQFESRLAWSVSHELGHLFILARNQAPFDGGEHIPGSLTGIMSAPQNVWTASFHEDTIKKIHLKLRASINRDQQGNVSP